MATDPLDLQSLLDEPGAETPWNGLEAGTVMGHVHLHVPHLDTAEAFYCGQVGFEPTVRGYPGALFVAAGGYHHHLGMNTWVGVGAPPPPEHAVGLRSFTIESPSTRRQRRRTCVDESTRSARVTETVRMRLLIAVFSCSVSTSHVANVVS